MGEIRIRLREGGDIELDDLDIGVADDVVAFDISGRVVGLDEGTLSELAGKRLTPVEVKLQTDDISPE